MLFHRKVKTQLNWVRSVKNQSECYKAFTFKVKQFLVKSDIFHLNPVNNFSQCLKFRHRRSAWNILVVYSCAVHFKSLWSVNLMQGRGRTFWVIREIPAVCCLSQNFISFRKSFILKMVTFGVLLSVVYRSAVFTEF